MPAIGATDNLADLENLDEDTLLSHLKTRFNRKVIYTYVGEILVTVNPFEWIDGIYGSDKMSQYVSHRRPPIRAVWSKLHTMMLVTIRIVFGARF